MEFSVWTMMIMNSAKLSMKSCSFSCNPTASLVLAEVLNANLRDLLRSQRDHCGAARSLLAGREGLQIGIGEEKRGLVTPGDTAGGIAADDDGSGAVIYSRRLRA